MRQALDHVAESSASTELVRERSNHRPSVDVFWRGFRGDERAPEINALGVGFAMPLGKSPRREPEVAKAFEEFASAQADLLETRRALDLQLHEAEHVLHTTRERLENSETSSRRRPSGTSWISWRLSSVSFPPASGYAVCPVSGTLSAHTNCF